VYVTNGKIKNGIVQNVISSRLSTSGTYLHTCVLVDTHTHTHTYTVKRLEVIPLRKGLDFSNAVWRIGVRKVNMDFKIFTDYVEYMNVYSINTVCSIF
jgi:hypothetical protein